MEGLDGDGVEMLRGNMCFDAVPLCERQYSLHPLMREFSESNCRSPRFLLAVADLFMYCFMFNGFRVAA